MSEEQLKQVSGWLYYRWFYSHSGPRPAFQVPSF